MAICGQGGEPAGEASQFKPKNGLRKLKNYVADPGAEFWEQFPVNKSLAREALIDYAKLRKLAEM